MPVDTAILPPRYRSPRRIASGGMGEIFRATDASLGRVVAVKLLAERHARDESVRKRFTREALAGARLSGEPNIVTIFDVGEHAERPFIVMEYLGGGSLEQQLRNEGAQEPSRALDWLEQAALALDAAHRNGVVHRDVKPANLLLDHGGNVHVADFGIASAAGTDSLTMTGTVLGTAGYLSPEQAQGERATPASDRYALAVVAFELLTGRRPFESDSMTAEAAAHVNAPVPSVAEVFEELPAELDPVFRQALAKNPEERFGSAAEFVASLRTALAEAAGATRTLPRVAASAPATVAEGRGARVPRRLPWAWIGLIALLVAGGVAGAIAAAVFTHDKSAAPRTRTVVRKATRPRTTAPPPRTATEVPAVSGRSLNDAGYTRMQAGDYADALPLLQQAVVRLRGVGYPNEAYANYNLGYTLLQLGRCSEALTYLQTAQRLEPWRPEVDQAISRAQDCGTPGGKPKARGNGNGGGNGKGHGNGKGGGEND